MKTIYKSDIQIEIAMLQARYELFDLPQAGYEVSRSKETADHTGIIAGRGKDGYIYIIHNHTDHGVSLIRLQDFTKAGKIYFTNAQQDDHLSVLSRALKLIGCRYHAIEFNGQHFSSYCRTGNKNGHVSRGFFSALFGNSARAGK